MPRPDFCVTSDAQEAIYVVNTITALVSAFGTDEQVEFWMVYRNLYQALADEMPDAAINRKAAEILQISSSTLRMRRRRFMPSIVRCLRDLGEL